MVVALFLIYVCVVIPAAVIWSGFVLAKLWAWFVVPTFGIAQLSIPAAIGVALIVSYMTLQKQKDDKKEFKDKFVERIGMFIFKPAVTLLIGWVVSFWM